MKIAIYLGSFNPFHNGYLEVVKTALNDFKMDKVIIVPTMQNPWKEEKVLDIDKRIGIIHTILKNSKNIYDFAEDYCLFYSFPNKIIYIDTIEKNLTPPYYSYATLHALKNKYHNNEIFVLCGEDTIEDIPNWMNGEQIIQDYNFLICDRTEISSTDIRNKIKEGKDISNLVGKNVINLIKKYYG